MSRLLQSVALHPAILVWFEDEGLLGFQISEDQDAAVLEEFEAVSDAEGFELYWPYGTNHAELIMRRTTDDPDFDVRCSGTLQGLGWLVEAQFDNGPADLLFADGIQAKEIFEVLQEGLKACRS